MKLFSTFFVASLLFIGCASDEDIPGSDKDHNKRLHIKPSRNVTKAAAKPAPVSTPDSELANANTTTEQVTTDLAAAVEPPASLPTPEMDIAEPKQDDIVSLGDPSIAAPPVSDSEQEDTVPLELTEDQQLIAEIKKAYGDYLNLQKDWANHYSSKMEGLTAQTTNQELLDHILFIQSHINDMPVTLSEITQTEEALSEAGEFTSPEYREEAEELREHIIVYFDMMDAAVELSLSALELIEQNEVTHPQTEDAETLAENASSDTPEQTVVVTDVAEPTTIVTVTEDASKDTVEPIVIAEEDASKDTVEPIVIAEEDASKDTVEPIVIAEEDASDNTPEETVAEEDTSEDAIEPTVAEDTSEDATEGEEETSIMEDITSAWDDVQQWFFSTFNVSNLREWIAEPTSVHIPNINRSIPEETDIPKTEALEDETAENPNSSSYQLVDKFLQDLRQLNQMRGIEDIHALGLYLDGLSPEIPVSASETAILNTLDQTVQDMTNQTDDIAGFVESSGYTSDALSQEDIVTMILMFSYRDYLL